MPARTKTIQGWARHLLPITLIAISAITLQGCQDGVSNESQPVTDNTPVSTYSGPAARTTDIQNFRISLWEPLRAENRCGGCHGTDAPTFVREDDVNLAYEAVNPFINRSEPDASILVTKVANGHNCWQGSDSACADIITTYIENWVGNDTTVGREIDLDPPETDYPVVESRQFPDLPPLGFTALHNELQEYCSECHAGDALSPQSPYFADAEVNVAYPAVQNSVNLNAPDKSSIVTRLRDKHNCWDDCDNNADTMLGLIETMAGNTDSVLAVEGLIYSRALGLGEGIIASGGSRHETDLIALYEFKAGEGNVAYDTSGVDPAINLTLSNSGVSWVKGFGLEFNGGKAQGVTSDSSKLSDLIKATGEYSIEAWVVPANVTQEGPARIISYSAGINNRNFTLGQTLYNYNFMHRSSTTDGNGEPALNTADGDQDLQASQQHVVITYDPANGRRIYVNNEHTGDIDETEAGNLSDWDDTYALILGSEPSGEYQWAGKIRLLAIHNRALTAAQIQQNFDAGVGEKYFLMFNIDEPLGVDPNNQENFMVLEVSEFDNYSYHFRDARYVNLSDQPGNIDFTLKGMRIGINSREAAMGQAFDNLDEHITSNYQSIPQGSPDEHTIATGTTIPLEYGEDSDQFFLTFDELNGLLSTRDPEVAYEYPDTTTGGGPVSEIGLRTFEEIDASMSKLTGVLRTNGDVSTTYTTIKQQLPSTETIDGFLSSHQVAISQLAIEYCNALVDDSSLRASFFPGFPFSTNADDIDDTTWEEGVMNPLIEKFLGLNLVTQPSQEEVRIELRALLTERQDEKPYNTDGSPGGDGLPDGLARCGGPCPDNDRTETVTKAACASVLGSAILLLQ